MAFPQKHIELSRAAEFVKAGRQGFCRIGSAAGADHPHAKSGAEAAECLGIAPRTADRAWRYARAWLYTAMAGPDSGEK